MDEQDDMDAAYAQQENEERRQREDRLLARHATILNDFRADNAAYTREMEEQRQRLKPLRTLT